MSLLMVEKRQTKNNRGYDYWQIIVDMITGKIKSSTSSLVLGIFLKISKY